MADERSSLEPLILRIEAMIVHRLNGIELTLQRILMSQSVLSADVAALTANVANIGSVLATESTSIATLLTNQATEATAITTATGEITSLLNSGSVDPTIAPQIEAANSAIATAIANITSNGSSIATANGNIVNGTSALAAAIPTPGTVAPAPTP